MRFDSPSNFGPAHFTADADGNLAVAADDAPAANAVIEPGIDVYDDVPAIVITFPYEARGVTVAQFAKNHELAAYGHDDHPSAVLYVDRNGATHSAKVTSTSSPFGEDGYATVSGEIQDAETGAVIARFSYHLDGRA